jgi:hypothetical protein
VRAAWDDAAWIIGSIILAAAVLGVAMNAVVIAIWAGVLAATRSRRNPKSPFPDLGLRAPRGVWQERWARFLRHLLRKHHVISGERDRIELMGVGAFLRADDVYRADVYRAEGESRG